MSHSSMLATRRRNQARRKQLRRAEKQAHRKRPGAAAGSKKGPGS